MKQYGVLGYPAKHSLSPVVYDAAFKVLGMDAQFGVFEIEERELDEFMKYVLDEPVYGLSVTSPYKQSVMKYLDEVSDEAKAIGAVNCVANKDGRLIGYNVDYIGIVKALAEVCGELKGRRVSVLGAGGAGRAAVYGLVGAGCEVSVFNRGKEKALAVGSEFGCGSGGLDEVSGGDILVQTTSIWISDEGAEFSDLVSLEALSGFDVVMDIVYKPLKTPLLEAAERLGKKIVSGDKMLLYQAFEAFKKWTGEEAPKEVMREALDKAIG